MVKSLLRPTLGELCQTLGLTLGDLARASRVTLSSIKQLEQKPPRKKTTWRLWKRRILDWAPLFGPTFPEVLTSRALSTCPSDVLEELLSEYNRRRSTQDILSAENIPTQSTTPVAVMEQKYLEQANILDAMGYWDEAEIWMTRAARLYSRHTSQWARQCLTIAQMRVNQGELASAEELIDQTKLQHQAALDKVGGEWDPSNRALAESTRAWSLFLRGKIRKPREGFSRTIQYARESNDVPLIHRGLHMGARALAEPDIMRAYFSGSGTARKLGIMIARQSLRGVEAALELDKLSKSVGSPNEAFGLWYKGLLQGLSGDVTEGRRLLERAESQLRINGLVTAALSGPRLSRIHFDVMSTSDPYALRHIEYELRDMFLDLMFEKYPYAFADALITLAFCRIRQSALRTPFQRREAADLLCAALVAHPYPQHVLWQMGLYFLINAIAPAFTDKEHLSFIRTLSVRVRSGEGRFGYLSHWRFDLSPLETIVDLLKTDGEKGKDWERKMNY